MKVRCIVNKKIDKKIVGHGDCLIKNMEYDVVAIHKHGICISLGNKKLGVFNPNYFQIVTHSTIESFRAYEEYGLYIIEKYGGCEPI